MSRVTCVEITCKSALNRVQGMPFGWSLNAYAGCAHACHYCYARAFYARAGHGDADRDFETRLLVKTNIAEVLARELSRPSWRGEQIALGTATDCYQPIEGRYRLTRALLEVLLAHRNPVGLVTKAPLVLRDADLLAALAGVAPVRVYVTITTLDPGLWRSLEPGTPNPRKRLEAVQRLNAAGVPAGVLMAPVLPGITDSESAIEALAEAAEAHGAVFFGASALRLAPGVREHFLDWLAVERSDLLGGYERAYRSTNAPSSYLERLEERIAAVRTRHGFTETRRPLSASAPPGASDVPNGAQLALPL